MDKSKPRSILDAAREHKAGLTAAPSQPAQRPIGRPPQALGLGLKGTKNGPPPIAYEVVKASCGHGAPLPLFADNVDKYRAARRAKAQNRPCPACFEEATLRARREAKARKKATKNAGKAGKPWRAEAAGNLTRLPDGAEYVAKYDHGTKQWTGVLTVPGAEPVTATASGLFRLLAVLDRLHRGMPLDGLTDEGGTNE